MEVIKNMQDELDINNTKSISLSRRRNVAKAYGWWASRDAISLTILKVLHSNLNVIISNKILAAIGFCLGQTANTTISH